MATKQQSLKAAKALASKHGRAMSLLAHSSMTKAQRIARAEKASKAASIARTAKAKARKLVGASAKL